MTTKNADPKNEVFKRVQKCLMSILKTKHKGKIDVIPKITVDTDMFVDLGIDSLESLDFLNELENEFGVSPNQYDINDIKKVGQIVDYVINLMKLSN